MKSCTTGAVLMLICLAVCSCGLEEGDRRGTLSRGDHAQVPDVQQVFAMAAELDEDLTRHVAECMEERGFPQLQEAARLSVDRDPQGHTSPLVADPLEAGPYTEEQARRYGVLGVGLLFQDDEPGYVVSGSSDYDRTLLDCRKDFDKSRGINSLELLNELDDVTVDQMRARFIEELDDRVAPLLSARSDCVRANGYPSLSDNLSASIGDTLTPVGISADENPAPPPQPVPDVPPGSVLVLPPGTPPAYVPSHAEVDFALTIVRCADDQHFADRWTEAQTDPRRVVVAQFGEQVATLGQVIAAGSLTTEDDVRIEGPDE